MKLRILQGRRARRDAIILILSLLSVWAAAIYFDLFEHLHQFVLAHEQFQLDEILVPPLLLSFCMVWFAWRRWQDQQTVAEALRVSEERFAYAMRGANDGLWDWNLLTDEVYYSPRWKSMLGYQPDELGSTLDIWAALVHPDDKERVLQKVEVYMDGLADSFEAEMRMQHKAGHWVTVLSRGYLTRDGDSGQPLRLVGTHVDISERIENERALAESQKRLADAQQLAHIGNWELNLVDNHLYWSDEVFRMFEIDPKQFGASYEAFIQAIHPEDRGRVHRAYTDSVASRRPYGIEHRLLMPDGRVKYVHEWGETYYDDHGEPVRSVGTVQDISELKELELQLFQSQKMEAIGTLVGGIAHDFNNILGAIEGNIYLAKLKSDNPEVTAKLHVVETLERRAAEMVSQLLAFARKDAVSLQVIRLNDFLGDAIALAGTAIPERIGLALDICDEPLCVKGDLTQLQQVLLNLLNNARDAIGGRHDGAIRCILHSRAPSADLRKRFPSLQGEQFACIEVEDNGEGIEPANTARIFEPFFTTKDVGEGTGLGLAMVYGVIERAGGAIDVQSMPGEGTVFRIYLPLVNEDAEEAVVHDLGDVVSGRGELVLVVDDENEVRHTTAEVLRSLGYSVREAENGRKAVELFAKYRSRVRLVVMDLVMPEMGGIAAAREIRAINARVPIVFATGYDKDRELPQEKMLSNSIVINKPFPFDRFSYLLSQLIDEDEG